MVQMPFVNKYSYFEECYSSAKNKDFLAGKKKTPPFVPGDTYIE